MKRCNNLLDVVRIQDAPYTYLTRGTCCVDGGDKELLRLISEATFAHFPMMLIYGENDVILPIAHAVQVCVVYMSANVPHHISCRANSMLYAFKRCGTVLTRRTSNDQRHLWRVYRSFWRSLNCHRESAPTRQPRVLVWHRSSRCRSWRQ
jgi:hypothetical protein